MFLFHIGHNKMQPQGPDNLVWWYLFSPYTIFLMDTKISARPHCKNPRRMNAAHWQMIHGLVFEEVKEKRYTPKASFAFGTAWDRLKC